MRSIVKILRFLVVPMERARGLRRDESGQVMLLTGIMAFLVVIMCLFALNTSQAIYNRVVAQNAVDSAADSAALWQARGCNFLQHLNNLHYDGNLIMLVAEMSMLGACVAGVALKAFGFTYIAGEAACVVCAVAPLVDKAQEVFSEAILQVQAVAKEIFPVLAFGYANACAKGSGADPLGDVLSTCASDFLGAVGIEVPGFEEVGDVLGAALGEIPIYAMVLDPESLSLHVDEEEAGEWDMPWSFPQAIAVPLAVIGYGCSSEGFNYNTPDDWGWQDSYYTGNPGFMTWIAGKGQREEITGLGNLMWFNPGEAKSFEEMETISRTFYKGANLSGDKIKIPSFLAIASSQVEGEPVISYGEANAKPKIITVHFPPDDNPKEGTSMLIYH